MFAQTYPADLHIIQLDNGGFHHSLSLSIPENIILVFQPAYSPEANPIERLWEYLKEQLKWKTFVNLHDLRNYVQKILSQLSNQLITSLAGWQFILEALSVAGI